MKLSTLTILLALTQVILAQTSSFPIGMNFQAVLRTGTTGESLSDKSVLLRISITSDSAGSNSLYSEVHSLTTSSLGGISCIIGKNFILSSGELSSVDWSNGSRYLKVEYGEAGENNFELFSISELMAVPYSFHAKTVEKEFDPEFSKSVSAKITAADTTRWNSIKNITFGNPVGSVIFYAASTPPSGYLVCDSSAVSRTEYAALFSVLGTTFGSGDGKNTFNLPDLRGEFIRGYSQGVGIDSSRVFGSYQNDEFKSHRHQYPGGQTGLENDYWIQGRTVDFNAQTLYTDYTGGAETRPRNIALLPCIKY